MPGPEPGVWPRGKTGWWYTTIKGTQHKLCKGTKKEALEELRKLLGKPLATTRSHAAVADVLDAYLDWLESPDSNTKPRRLADVQACLKSFAQYCGSLRIANLEPKHAKAWLDANPTWNPSTRSLRVKTVRGCFNWAMKDEIGLIDRQPFGKFHGGQVARREFLPSDSDITKLLAYPNQRYREFITALTETGCRPSEVSRVEACDVDLKRRCWTLTRHKNEKRKAARVVWLNSVMLDLTKKLMKAQPVGPLFRTTTGVPWNLMSVKQAFRQLRASQKLDPKVCAYSIRHWFITRALSNGTDALTVATAVGTSVQMLQKHYSHLMQVPERMVAVMEKASRRKRKGG